MEKVEQFIEKHSLIKPNKIILIGVSGGPDSIALLHFLSERREQWNIKIVALTVNHQLRVDAAEDVAYVKQVCETLNIQCVTSKIDVEKYEKQHGLSTQVAARTLRYRFFEKQMNKFQADYLALGHHADDQLETMLMSMARSTSTVALSGIPFKRPFANGMIIRPFLSLTKAEINAYCIKHELNPKIDPSNEDLSYTRNYFRKMIVPLMQEQNSNLSTTLQHLSESLQFDEQYIMKQAKIVWKSIVTVVEENEQITFKRQYFLKQPKALQRRVFHLILNYLYEELPNLFTYTHADNFYSLLTSEKSQARINFPHQLLIKKSYDDIHMYFKSTTKEKRFLKQTLNVPGKVTLPKGSIIYAEHVNTSNTSNAFTHFVDVDADDLPLYVRTRQPGDRMSWYGLNGRKKLKDIFIDEKIPHAKRDQWPVVVTSNDDIVWLVGLKKGHLMQKEIKQRQTIKLIYTKDLHEGGR